MFRSKLRLYTIFVAVGALLAGVSPYAARAQSGDALAHAERTCLDQGIGPNSVTFDACTERAASAYDEGEEAARAASSCRATADRRPNDLLDRNLEASDDAGIAASREQLGIGIASRHPCISLLGVGDDVRVAPGTDREELGGFLGGVAERV